MLTIFSWFLVALRCSSGATSSHALIRTKSGAEFSRSLVKPKEIENYSILTSEQIETQLQSWASSYPDLTSLTTAQEKYNLPRAGGADDCPFVEGDGCPNSILTIQDFIAHPEGSDSSNRLPEVLWSGELHGDEQVGPTSVIKATDLLLRATACLALPRLSVQKEAPSEWIDEVEKAKQCRQSLGDFGIGEQDVWWLGRLVSTRRIVVIPTTNALGYFRRRREENRIDPNRDFPYDYLPNASHPDYNTKCMQTIAARTLNEVFREHMFQLSFTFHGGMEVIGYEWGAPSFKKPTSPDDVVQNQIATAYSQFGGGWEGTKPYEFGPMNSLVYPVRGGMEDWAYAGSWDRERVIPCKPSTYTEYPIEKTQYNNATLRVLNMLVETSDDKIPRSHLGSSEDLLDGLSIAGNGHISRNVRLALLSAEMVEPWLAIRRVNGVPLMDDIIPMMNRTGRESCQEFKLVTVPCYNTVVIEWTVGGALSIDDSKLWYAKWSDVPEMNCIGQPPLKIEQFMKEGTAISGTSGKTRFSSNGTTSRFSASLDLSSFEPHDSIVVVVSARVDQEWGTQPKPYQPKGIPPQSHMANVRTNPHWYFKVGEKVIEGRLDWFSSPLTIKMGEYSDPVDAIEMSIRLPRKRSWSTNSSEESMTNINLCKVASKSQAVLHRTTPIMFTLLFIVLAVFVIGCVLRARMRSIRRKQVLRFISDESAPTPGASQIPDMEPEDMEDVEPFRDEPGHGEDRNGLEMERYD